MATRSNIAFVIHGHFYQPPRENPWSDEVEREPSAAPLHDWNARIHAECYRANAFARVHDKGGGVRSIVNNYARMSFNFGPTLARWIEQHDARSHGRLIAADTDQRLRLGDGGAVAQAYAHPILPLAAPADRRTQVLWGLQDFRRRFGRDADGLWLPETAANAPTLETLIELGVRFTILAPEQVAAVRAPGGEWTTVDRDTVDTGRAYRWMHPDGSGRFLSIAVFDGPLSRGVAFGDATHNAASFVAAVQAAAKRSRVDNPLVLCASDGELFGHHKKFADLNLAFTTFVEGPRHGIDATNLAAYLGAHPPTWEMKLNEGPDGRGTAWSCAHGVGRWWRDCGCTMARPDLGWNHKWRTPLRTAMDRLQQAAASFYEDAGSELLVDPWGARDAYGTVVDAPLAAREALLASFATPAWETGGETARARALTLLEMQRATLLMFASCGWYFDDVAGLEASLILRLAAHAVDLMRAAGGTPPVDEMMDILADAKSNQPGAGTGADVFRQVSADRLSPSHALAQVALSLLTAEDESTAGRPSGYAVELMKGAPPAPAMDAVAGQAKVVARRTGIVTELDFSASWDPKRGFLCTIAGQDWAPHQLGREARHALLPRLLPRLEHEAEPLLAARWALDLGHGVVGGGTAPEDIGVQRTYARLLLRVLFDPNRLTSTAADVALELCDAAGDALAPGTAERLLAEETVAELIATASGRARFSRLARRLGFSAAAAAADADQPLDKAKALAEPPESEDTGH